MSNVIYQDGGLKFWDGSEWIPFSTSSLPPIENANTDLLLDDDRYYLPITLSTNQRVNSVSVNGISLTFQVNYNTSPARIYGFENNSLSTILTTIQ